MKIETYEIERADDETLNAIHDGEAKQLIETLGLPGQEKFYNPDSLESVPYRKMTKMEGLVFQLLCPQVAKIENYKDGIIPLRVLQVYQHAKSLDFFDKGFVIWYPESADIKDPFLIGHKTGDPSHITEQYILARWGEELWTFDKMKECAEKLYREKLMAKMARIRREVDAYWEQINSSDALDLATGMPYFSK